MIKSAYAYIRVSTYTQVDGKSLDGQLEEIKQYCKAFNITLMKDILERVLRADQLLRKCCLILMISRR